MSGHYESNGKPVDEFHCEPATPGKHPAVILLHGAAPKGASLETFQQMCSELADHGYYAMFVEYYSQTEVVGPGQPAKMVAYFPTWLAEIDSGIGELNKNPKVEPSKIALMGFSLGAALSLTQAAADSSEVAAVVDYYGPVAPPVMSMISQTPFPPTLILHGDADKLVPVAQSKELDDVLTKKNRPHEIHIYAGADHAFNFPQAVMWYREADAKDAWNRSLAFLDKNLKH
jgi:carboxymethylenebutenolidase